MVKYITKVRGAVVGGWDDEPGMTADTIHEDDYEPEDTGLITSAGDKIYRHRESVPFGFIGSKTKL